MKELLRWDRAGGKEIPALKVRREAEVKLWQSGQAEQQAA